MPSTPTPSAAQAIGRLDAACRALVAFRSRPLLVMYYPPGAMITELDIRDTYAELRRGNATKENRLPKMDLLLHTYGGDPVAGYRVSQVLRSLCKEMDVLVPEHAYSAGTLMSFAGDTIRLGDYAGLSPIDITVTEQNSPKPEGVQLAGVDSFLEFARGAREKMEEYLKRLDRNGAQSTVDSDLLVQMVKEIGALTVGRYYRERTLTGHYSQLLLESYMFLKESDCRSRANATVSHFLFGAPSHDFHLDYRLCKEWHLKVTPMPTDESDIAKVVVAELRACTDNSIICQRLNHRVRMPFITFYSLPRRRTPHAARNKQKRNTRTGDAKTT